MYNSHEPLVRRPPETLRLPNQPCSVFPAQQWAHEAWKQHPGSMGVIVPAEALLELLRRAGAR